MFRNIKKFIKSLTPNWALSLYHLFLARVASTLYGNPSEKMIVIGITGTKGKSSAANFIWSALEEAGYKTGVTGTASIKIGQEDFPNTYHMTMPGRFALQGLLAKMYKAGCKIAIVETTSEGLKQWRHVGINFDFAIFTNLYREHLPSHEGSMDKYREAKGKLFEVLSKGKTKILNGKPVPKTIITNSDDPYSVYFYAFGAEKKLSYGLNQGAQIWAKNINTDENGSSFDVNNYHFALSIPGKFNVLNALPAIGVLTTLGVDETIIASGLKKLKNIPGRMEVINAGQPFKVYVDYAHQKESMEALLETGRNIVKQNNGKVIILLGAEGGGRDKAKRPAMGELAGKIADYVIVSNVDPYEDDPKEIIEDIASVAEKAGKQRNVNLFCIEDRREGINKALSLAKPDDIVLITGKGSEQSIVIGGKSSPWDDRSVVREEINKLINK